MRLDYLQKPNEEWNERIPKSKEFPRHWRITKTLIIRLSDKRQIIIPAGTIWDGASFPKWLWWLFKPIDEGAIGDAIHDQLWKNKESELKHFGYEIFEARKFADDERVLWRNAHAPNKKIKTRISHFFIRKIGGFFYSRQLKIPN